MYPPYKRAIKYLRYLISAENGRGHGVHSPFVFDFIRKVLRDRKVYPEYRVIEDFRRELLRNHTPLPVEDYGAGSVGGIGSRSVAGITATAAKSPKYAQLLFRIARYYHPMYILELGTSLGISTAYLASAVRDAFVVTGEGNFVVASMARNHFEQLQLPNIRVITGNFDNTLPEMAGSVPYIDLAFIDGNHREKPTITYFHELLPRMSASSMIIFDDIHWSRGMENAWDHIRQRPEVLLSIDLFFFGIVVFRPEFKVKQHFTIRY